MVSEMERFLCVHSCVYHCDLEVRMRHTVKLVQQVWSSLADECLRVLSTELQSSKPDGLAIVRGIN